MSRLPVPGQDDGAWGNILNDFLTQSLNADGTLKSSALTEAGGLTEAVADERYVPTGDVGAHSGVASLDSGGDVPLGQLGNVPTVTVYSQFITQDVDISSGGFALICSKTLSAGTYIPSFVINTSSAGTFAIIPHGGTTSQSLVGGDGSGSYGAISGQGPAFTINQQTTFDLIFDPAGGGFGNSVSATTQAGYLNATGMSFIKIA